MDATLKMWGPAVLIIVIEHTMNDSRSVRKSVLIRYILSIVCLKLNRFSHLSFMQYMGLYPGAVCIQLTHLLWWLWEYVYFILLSSSNRKYDPFPVA